MTAIFTYVEDDTAFICADARRAIHVLSSIATKVHHRWSEYILLAQTGAGEPMTELLCEMTVWRDRQPGLVTFQGLVDVFNHLRPKHYAAATNRLKIAVNGIVVAACASDGQTPAQIVTFDFATGNQTVVGSSGSAYADGTDQVAFQQIADNELRQFKTAGALELDGWAIACLSQAVASYPANVGWPADLAIVRPYPTPVRLTVLRRIYSPIEGLHSVFAL